MKLKLKAGFIGLCKVFYCKGMVKYKQYYLEQVIIQSAVCRWAAMKKNEDDVWHRFSSNFCIFWNTLFLK
ncbi:hypothetical protein BFG52_10985 [Acinetobacter larvae]|uniref:Uncharacterized protein n=1 Tax=Acinetobacter larvae TaxID=1789224 RepID=A0A1B2M0U7_9GAMM|nr:hypothetical protein BFG52_10985 [Acinetobacter larvae]